MIQLVKKPPSEEKPELSLGSEESAEQLPLPPSKDFNEFSQLEQTQRGRLAIFIDGASLFYAASQMGIEIDYAKLLNYFRQTSKLVYAFFFTGADPNNSRQQSFLMWMRRNGYRVITKDVILNPAGTKRVGSMNVEIAVDMMRSMQDCDTQVLISGDGDLAYAINAVTYSGTRVEVYALRSMTSENLIRVADCYTDLASIRQEIQKEPRH